MRTRPDRRPLRVPEKWGHALSANTDRTLCGRPVRGLFRFDSMLFEHLGHPSRVRAVKPAAVAATRWSTAVRATRSIAPPRLEG
jgi:hypothetical protein